MITLKQVTINAKKSSSGSKGKKGKSSVNCGVGPGGFQPGNKCAVGLGRGAVGQSPKGHKKGAGAAKSTKSSTSKSLSSQGWQGTERGFNKNGVNISHAAAKRISSGKATAKDKELLAKGNSKATKKGPIKGPKDKNLLQRKHDRLNSALNLTTPGSKSEKKILSQMKSVEKDLYGTTPGTKKAAPKEYKTGGTRKEKPLGISLMGDTSIEKKRMAALRKQDRKSSTASGKRTYFNSAEKSQMKALRWEHSARVNGVKRDSTGKVTKYRIRDVLNGGNIIVTRKEAAAIAKSYSFDAAEKKLSKAVSGKSGTWSMVKKGSSPGTYLIRDQDNREQIRTKKELTDYAAGKIKSFYSKSKKRSSGMGTPYYD